MSSPLPTLRMFVITAGLLFLASTLTGCSGSLSSANSFSGNPSSTPTSAAGSQPGTAASNAGGGSSGTGGSAAAAAQFLYVGGAGNKISGVRITNGAASAIPGSPFAVGGIGFSMASAGDLILTYGSNSSPLQIWRIDAQTGALKQLASTSDIAGQLAVAPKYNFVYGSGGSNIYGYSIDHQTGRLTPLPGSPYQDAHQISGPHISPDGLWICGAGFEGPGVPGDISCARRDPTTGAILSGPGNQVSGEAGSANGGGPFVAGGYLLANTLQSSDAGGASSYAQNGIGVFTVGSAGITESKAYSGAHGEIAVDQSGTRVAIGDNSTVTLFSFNPVNATLTQFTQINVAHPAAALSFTCDGNYLAVADNIGNAVAVYAVSSTGLQEVNGSPVPVAKDSFGLAIAACMSQ